MYYRSGKKPTTSVFKDFKAEGSMISNFFPSSSFFSFFLAQNWRVKKESELSENFLRLVPTGKATAIEAECRTSNSRFAEWNRHPFHMDFKCFLQTSFNPVLGTPQLLDHIWCALWAYFPAQFNPKGNQLPVLGQLCNANQSRVSGGDQKIQFLRVFLIQTKILMYTCYSALQQTLVHSSCLSDDLF